MIELVGAVCWGILITWVYDTAKSYPTNQKKKEANLPWPKSEKQPAESTSNLSTSLGPSPGPLGSQLVLPPSSSQWKTQSRSQSQNDLVADAQLEFQQRIMQDLTRSLLYPNTFPLPPSPPPDPDTQRSKDDLPLVLGPILGFRRWIVNSSDGQILSVTASKIWIPLQPMEGDIDIEYPMGGFIGDPIVRGGVYAYNKMSSLPTYGSRYIPGGVWLWGQVDEHVEGYRASMAYPAFFIGEIDQKIGMWEHGHVRLETIAKLYNVPIRGNYNHEPGLDQKLLDWHERGGWSEKENYME